MNNLDEERMLDFKRKLYKRNNYGKKCRRFNDTNMDYR